MKLTVKRPVEIEVDAIRVELPVNYGEEDIPNNFPLRDGDMWRATIDIATGQIRDWPPYAGKEGSRELDMKVVDEGSYYLMSGSEVVASIEQDYVPKCIPGRYGDYVELTIDANGRITNWIGRQKDIMESFFVADRD